MSSEYCEKCEKLEETKSELAELYYDKCKDYVKLEGKLEDIRKLMWMRNDIMYKSPEQLSKPKNELEDEIIERIEGIVK